MLYEIAGLTLEVQGASEFLKSCMADYALPLHQERERLCDSGIFIQRYQDILFPKEKQIARAGIWSMAKTDQGDMVYRTFPGTENLLSAQMIFSKHRADISLFSMEESDIANRDLLFSGQAFSQLVLSHKRMVLHSSCIEIGGKAILFSAPSGTGKSTHTGLWQTYYPETRYINDDTPVLRFDTEEVLACGSPWSGKNRLNQNITAPLAAVIFLERGKTNQLEAVSKIEAMGRVLGECRKIPFRSAIQVASELCGELIERVPVYRLTCDISREAVDTVRTELRI